VINLQGHINKRKKKLSKMRYGTSHIVSLEEAKQIYSTGAELLIVGTGQNGLLKLSDDAEAFFRKNGCQVELQPTPRAIVTWNTAEGAVIGLFHVTC